MVLPSLALDATSTSSIWSIGRISLFEKAKKLNDGMRALKRVSSASLTRVVKLMAATLLCKVTRSEEESIMALAQFVDRDPS